MTRDKMPGCQYEGRDEIVCRCEDLVAATVAPGGDVRERTYLVVRFDVTDLSEDERGSLAMEVVVQAEASDVIGNDGHGWVGHRSVEAECEWETVTP